LKFERFIAHKLRQTQPLDSEQKRRTNPIIRIAIGGIALGVVIMILAIAILTGFQKEIKSKVVGFGGHIDITKFQSADGYDLDPVSKEQDFYPTIDSLQEIANISVYANKAGILKTKDEILGVVLKGVDQNYHWDFFEKNLVEGQIIHLSDSSKNDSVLISESIANKMRLSIDDKLIIYFIQNQKARPRRFYVAGIYKTGLEDFDNLLLLGDIKHIQKINDWEPNQVGGFEINLGSFEDLERMDQIIYENIPFQLKSTTIKQRHSDIFGWLELQDVNVIIIIVLMILVCGINMTSALLIMILDRSQMIGIFKALGASNWNIRKIFLLHASYLIGVGLLWGNLIGLGLAFIQLKTGFITLDQETYYIDRVPIHLEPMSLIVLNACTMLLCVAMLIIPSYFITKISPVKAIKFD